VGLQIRKRTKGKNSWFNFSKSGISLSTKVGNVTTNMGPRGLRTTVNLGNGVRYVKYRSAKRANESGGILLNTVHNLFRFSVFVFIVYYIKEFLS